MTDSPPEILMVTDYQRRALRVIWVHRLPLLQLAVQGPFGTLFHAFCVLVYTRTLNQILELESVPGL